MCRYTVLDTWHLQFTLDITSLPQLLLLCNLVWWCYCAHFRSSCLCLKIPLLKLCGGNWNWFVAARSYLCLLWYDSCPCFCRLLPSVSLLSAVSHHVPSLLLSQKSSTMATAHSLSRFSVTNYSAWFSSYQFFLYPGLSPLLCSGPGFGHHKCQWNPASASQCSNWAVGWASGVSLLAQSKICRCSLQSQQDRQCACNLTLRCVHATVVSVEKQ